MRKSKVDIVFLMDATGAQQPIIDAIRDNMSYFFEQLDDPSLFYGGIRPGVRLSLVDWRAKVVAYRDEEADVDDWYQDNPFVTDVESLKRQFAETEAYGGMDEPDSLLDALHKLCLPQSISPSDVDDPLQWRHIDEAKRVVIIFTDASYKESMTYPGGVGGEVSDVTDLLETERITMFLFAPELPCYEELSCVDKCEWEPIEEPFVDTLRYLCNDRARIQEILQAIARTVRY